MKEEGIPRREEENIPRREAYRGEIVWDHQRLGNAMSHKTGAAGSAGHKSVAASPFMPTFNSSTEIALMESQEQVRVLHVQVQQLQSVIVEQQNLIDALEDGQSRSGHQLQQVRVSVFKFFSSRQT